MARISNSKLDLYSQCGMKYKFKYIDKLKGNFTPSALLFGVAMDVSLNYILESIRDKKEWTKERCEEIFLEEMNKWNGEDRLDFFKGDVPKDLLEILDEDSREHQELIWDNLCQRGIKCISVYIENVLPQIDEVISVQNQGVIKNKEEDEFVFIVDFIAKMKDGRVVLLDNKTASSKYPKNKVVKSQQLSLYLEAFPGIKYAGYIVLIKNPEKEKGLTHQIMIDEIPEETKQESFDKLETALLNIKNEVFETNTKSCRLYNKPCEYWNLCLYGDKTGLVSTAKGKK